MSGGSSVERGPVAQNEPFAIGMAKLLDREGKTVAAAELRRLQAENGALKKAVALLQQHHATAWNRGHMMGMKATEDTARRALDAVQQDAWGNTQLTEALLKAEEQCDALTEANEAFSKREHWWNEKMFTLEQQRDALLEVLRSLLAEEDDAIATWSLTRAAARAAIKAVEETK